MPGQRYHRVTGLRYADQCRCGCEQKIEAGPDVVVVVDMDSSPKRRYIPGHDPESTAKRTGESYERARSQAAPPKEAPKTAQDGPSAPPKGSDTPTKGPVAVTVPTTAAGHIRVVLQVPYPGVQYSKIEVEVEIPPVVGEAIGVTLGRVYDEVKAEFDSRVEKMRLAENGGTV